MLLHSAHACALCNNINMPVMILPGQHEPHHQMDHILCPEKVGKFGSVQGGRHDNNLQVFLPPLLRMY